MFIVQFTDLRMTSGATGGDSDLTEIVILQLNQLTETVDAYRNVIVEVKH